MHDAKGNLYGATSAGGSTACGNSDGCGTIFKITPNGKHTILHTFTGGRDGWSPHGDLVSDETGTLYGTTTYGGTSNCANESGCGVVFRVKRKGKETILYRFKGTSDGATPFAGLLRDTAGNFLGTTYYGGSFVNNGFCTNFGCGVVFELSPAGSEAVLHAFDSSDGYFPDTGLAQDAKGNLYGATYSLHATLYRLSTTGKLKTLFQFNPDDANGTFPLGDVLIDRAGDLFVNNLEGGSKTLCSQGCGTLFELTADGTPLPLHEFGADGQDGKSPAGNLLRVGNQIYGVTQGGGQYGDGTVWVVSP